MTQTTDQERLEFEAWAQSKWRGINLAWIPSFSKYADFDTNTKWITWQASRRTQVVQMTLEQAQQSMRSATSHKPGKIIAASGSCKPQLQEAEIDEWVKSGNANSEMNFAKMAAPVQMPEPEATVESKLGTVCLFQSSNMRKGDKIYTEHQFRELLTKGGIKVVEE